MIVKVSTRFGGLSRGKCWARRLNTQGTVWAEKSMGTLYLTPGEWHVGSDDGFRRKDRGTVTVSDDGSVDGLPSGWKVSA